MHDRACRAAGVLVVLLAAVLPHLASLRHGFTYDDRDFIVNNASLRSFAGTARALLDGLPPKHPERGLYRPLTALSYSVDHAVGGGAPWPFHATNLVLYAALCALVLALLRAHLRPWPAAVGALFFALHPVHCEVVDSAAGRSELLALGLAVVGLRCAAWRGRAATPLTLVAAGLAALAKETGLMVVPVVIAADLLAGRTRRARWLGLAIVALAYLGLRAAALGRLTPGQAVLAGLGAPARLWTGLRVLAENARLLVWPEPLQVDYYYQQAVGAQSGPTLGAALGAILLATSLGALAWLAARALREAAPAPRSRVALGLALFLAFLVPTSHLVPIGALMAERFLFAPSLGAALLVGLVAEAVEVRARPAIARAALTVVVGGLAAFAWRSAARAAEWRDEATLWAATARDVHDDPRVLTNWARGLVQKRDREGARQLLERALAIDPRHLAAWNDLGYIELTERNFALAEVTFQRVVAIAPDNATAWNNLAAVSLQTGALRQGRERCERALAIDPNYQSARDNLAAADEALGRATSYLRDHPAPRAGDASDAAAARYLAALRALGRDDEAETIRRGLTPP